MVEKMKKSLLWCLVCLVCLVPCSGAALAAEADAAQRSSFLRSQLRFRSKKLIYIHKSIFIPRGGHCIYTAALSF